MSRQSTFTVICDRCGLEAQLSAFTRKDLARLASDGWWSYLSVRIGTYMDYTKAKDFCPSCAVQVAKVSRDSRSWVEYRDPALISQSDLYDEVAELTELMHGAWMTDLRDYLTKEIRKIRNASK